MSEAEDLFDRWSTCDEQEVNGHILRLLTEQPDGRDEILEDLVDVVRAHYDDPDSIADDVEELGYEAAAAILREQLPETRSARSGDIGEIVATEYVNAETDFVIPIYRLRFKDGRNMALRGDDLLGIHEDGEDLHYLKGEVKSRQTLSASVITQARKALDRWSGRPSAHTLLYVAKRLLESPVVADRALGRKIRNTALLSSVPEERVQHFLFALCGNDASELVSSDLMKCDNEIQQISVCFRIEDHGDFISAVYEEVANFGDD